MWTYNLGSVALALLSVQLCWTCIAAYAAPYHKKSEIFAIGLSVAVQEDCGGGMRALKMEQAQIVDVFGFDVVRHRRPFGPDVVLAQEDCGGGMDVLEAQIVGVLWLGLVDLFAHQI